MFRRKLRQEGQPVVTGNGDVKGRLVPMRVLGLGMSRTGTGSLCEALRILGYKDCYHGFDVLFKLRFNDIKLWRQACDAKFNGGKPFTKAQWDQLLGHCQAVTDLPPNIFGEELVEMYPDAKVVLTTRDVEKWYQSVRTVAKPDTRFGYYWLILWVIPGFMVWRETLRMGFRLSFGEDFNKNGRKVIENHNAHVRSLVPPERLLEFQVVEGWKPLCEFLGQPIPDVPFPYVNEKNAMYWGVLRIYVTLTVQALVLWGIYGTLAYLVISKTKKWIG